MKKILILCFLLTLLVSLFSCRKDFKYKIHNPNIHKPNGAIFYTDTIEFDGDSIGYHNSDGSYVLISNTFGLDCFIDTLK